jgi:hypothetical protein
MLQEKKKGKRHTGGDEAQDIKISQPSNTNLNRHLVILLLTRKKVRAGGSEQLTDTMRLKR